jgi:hypothetical protein
LSQILAQKNSHNDSKTTHSEFDNESFHLFTKRNPAQKTYNFRNKIDLAEKVEGHKDAGIKDVAPINNERKI